ncbi:feruloyl esterase [Corynebacterium uropygiale]|uniref:Feruloyl esterase n=1 Tax=Corynebacterium uropygiale TaxID=1775911 RepID=A0A9X1QRV6_9CORY|nr:PHB depolymerase family esterase [Corynebacterium uropygiale]MCF4006698.1 feruloyl esterase [Corynebacterium uropygiale]
MAGEKKRLSRVVALLGGIVIGLAVVMIALYYDTGNHSEQSGSGDLHATAPATRTATTSIVSPEGTPAFKSPGAGESATIQLASAGRTRQFILSVPRNFYPGRRIPVIFAFHGYGENAALMETYTHLDDAQALIVYPDGIRQSWEGAPYSVTNKGKDRQFVHDILAALKTVYPVDTERVFAAGFSNGGGFAAMIGCQMPDLFAGVALVSAAYYPAVHENCSGEPVALLDIHGTEDPVVKYDGGTRHGTRYDSVPAVLEKASRRNHCVGGSQFYRINRSAVRQDWYGCELPLSHIRVGEGVHAWPGAPNDKREHVPKNMATDEILRFFGIAKVPAR